jgi:CDP-diacylglycerol---glycerol-3-phosphate 3-phosphatidyltransferase
LSGSDPRDAAASVPPSPGVPAVVPGTEPPGDPEKAEMWSRERVVTGWAQLWNLPNMLTLLRILMIPFFWYLLMYDDGENAATRVAATVVFVLAAITDWLDGWLARKQGLVTTFGKIADPLADKALTGVALIGLSVLGELWWWVTILIILREVGVTVIRFMVLKHGVIAASRGGKAKTLFQMVGITMFLLPIAPDMTLLWVIRNSVMAIAVILTTLTGFDYVSKAYWTRSNSKSDKAARKAAAGAARAGTSGGEGSSAGVIDDSGSGQPGQTA